MRATTLLLTAGLLLSPGLGASAKKEAPAPAPGEPSYVALAPPLVSNLQTAGKPRFVRCEVQLMSERPEAAAKLNLHAPAIRHSLLLLFVEQEYEAIRTADAKEALRKNALESVRAVMRDKTGKPWVDDLYFTSFYVQ
jgi:flagellar FliL protein